MNVFLLLSFTHKSNIRLIPIALATIFVLTADRSTYFQISPKKRKLSGTNAYFDMVAIVKVLK
jgi:hypothetical protein